MHFHWQNLSTIDGRNGQVSRKRFPVHGRVWLSSSNSKMDLMCEWEIFSRSTGLGIHLGGDDTFGFYFQIPFILSIYVNVNVFRLLRKRRDISLRFHGGAMWWSIWLDRFGDMEVPKWQRFVRAGHFNPLDFFFGRQKCSTLTIEEREVQIPMPEKAYEATAKLVEYTWKRPRSPFIKRIVRCEIVIPTGIPHEGKGENSWDCGHDATFSFTTGSCNSITKGIGKLVGNVLSDRVKYGGWGDFNWKKTTNASK